MNNSIIWLSFKLGDLFSRNGSHIIKTPKKNLDESFYPDDTHIIKNITATKENNGCSGYLIDEGDTTEKKRCNLLTIASDAAYGGICFYQTEWFVSTGHSNILEFKNPKLKQLFDRRKVYYVFLSRLITKVLCLPNVNRFSRPVGNDFDREIILLPCCEAPCGEEYVWDKNGKHYTIALDYISFLMDEAQKKIDCRTIGTYKQQQRTFQKEKDFLISTYLAEKENIRWKSFKLGDLFERSTNLAYKKNQKDLDLSDFKDEEHGIALVSASRNGKGIVGYLPNGDVDSNLVSNNKITFDDQWGYTAFQDEDFVITGGHNAILEVKSQELKGLLDKNRYAYLYLSTMINEATFENGIFGYDYKINNKFDREIVLLPCLEIADKDNCLWSDGGKYYTLAVDYINYLYVVGRLNILQKKIDSYDRGF